MPAVYFPSFVNKDLVLLHKKSGTLLTADLIFNLPATEQYSRSGQSATRGIFNRYLAVLNPYNVWHRRFLWYAHSQKQREQIAEDAKAVDAWEFDRIIPAHGDIIETGGKKAWESAYAWFL